MAADTGGFLCSLEDSGSVSEARVYRYLQSGKGEVKGAANLTQSISVSQSPPNAHTGGRTVGALIQSRMSFPDGKNVSNSRNLTLNTHRDSKSLTKIEPMGFGSVEGRLLSSRYDVSLAEGSFGKATKYTDLEK